ncbi:MAG: aspartate aminotransferase family protein [SAR324 cluster bacterium]|nr:aspartate aminotransferase family protein [SAR324 cluster bacterium]
MNNETVSQKEMLQTWGNLVSKAQVNRLKSLGQDFVVAGSSDVMIYDMEGREYIDCHTSAGIFNLGRRHPEIQKHFQQILLEADQGNFPMISREKAILAKKLAEFAEGNLSQSMFGVTRGEALDFACKLARGYTGKARLLSVKGSCFGQTGFALSLSDLPEKALFTPLVPMTEIVDFEPAETLIQNITTTTAAIFLEPVQTENHAHEFSEELLRMIRKRCNETGTLLVFDETQTGMGRTGKKFAFRHHTVEPDMLVLGEAVSGGFFPLTVTLYTPELGTFMNAHPLIHLSTFGGSDLGCRVTLKALEVYEATQPWNNAETAGLEFQRGLNSLKQKYPPLRSVAGKGLLWSLRFGNRAQARKVCQSLAKNGVLCQPGRVDQNTVLLRPALTLQAAHIRKILDALEITLSALSTS